MIIISATLAARSLNKTVNSEFEGIATQNGLTVQDILDTADNAAMVLPVSAYSSSQTLLTQESRITPSTSTKMMPKVVTYKATDRMIPTALKITTKKLAESKENCFTEPYEDQGIHIGQCFFSNCIR